MRWLRKLRLRVRSLFDRSRVEDDLEDELRDYLERETELAIAAGSPPEEARRLAVRSLEGADRLKEACRDARAVRWIEDGLKDLRYALRTIRRAPAFALTVIAALALCIGANTAIFSVVDTVLFRPLPFPHQDRLVSITEGLASFGFPVVPFSPPDYLFVAANNRSFEATGTYRTQSYEISGAGQPRRATVTRLTASLFSVLGIQPSIGRAFTREEDEHSKRVVVLNYGFAQSAFGAPAHALGRTIFLDRKPYSVIGIMQQSFSFPIYGPRENDHPAELFVPVSWTNDDRKQEVHDFDYSMIARLRPNVTIQQANANVRGLLEQVAEAYPPEIKRYIHQRLPTFSLESQTIPFREEFAGNVQRPLLLLLAAVGVVLLIGCADVANLMFSRMVGRHREFALRAALGAGNWRLARQTITEGLVLSVLGGAAGFCLAFWTLPLLLRLAPDTLPRLNEIGLNWRVAMFVAAIALATPLSFCLAPLLTVVRSAIAEQLRRGGRTTTQGQYQRLVMSGTVIAQFSLAFVLLTTAGLLLRSFIKASEANPGFRPEHLLTERISLPKTMYDTPAKVTAFYDRLLEKLSALPGVQQTGAVSDLPMDSTSNQVVSAEGHVNTERVEAIFSLGNGLGTLGIPLTRGRLLQPGDELRKQPVAVISETLAKRLWPHEDPVGRHVKFGVEMNDEPWMTIVGVVKDVKDRLTSTSPRPMMFTSLEDWVTDMNVLVRSSADPLALASSIRHQVNQLDPSLPAEKVETLDRILDESLSAERFRTWLLTSFAAAALLLAMLGIGGLLAYNTAQRSQEFGIRIAVGADRHDLLFLVFRQTLRLSGLGIAVGLIASIFVTRAVAALLYDTSRYDAPTFVAVPLILALVALTASVLPAWRAVRTDPITALKAE